MRIFLAIKMTTLLYRSGDGGRRARYVTPDLSYTTGREGESSARTTNGMGKKRK